MAAARRCCWTLGLVLSLYAAAPAWAGARADESLRGVPEDATLVTSVNVEALEAHPAYELLRKRLVREAVLLPVLTDDGHPLGRRGALARAVIFHLDDGRQGALLTLRGLPWESSVARAQARTTLGDGYAEGLAKGHPWFTIARGIVLLDLPDGRLALSSRSLVERVATLATTRAAATGEVPRGWRVVAKTVRDDAAIVWSAGVGGSTVQRRLADGVAQRLTAIESVTMRVTGAQDLKFELVARVSDPAKATDLASWLGAEIRRVITSRVTYKVLGVAAILRRALPTAEGRRVASTLTLTKAQTRLLLRMAPNLISSFRGEDTPP